MTNRIQPRVVSEVGFHSAGRRDNLALLEAPPPAVRDIA